MKKINLTYKLRNIKIKTWRKEAVLCIPSFKASGDVLIGIYVNDKEVYASQVKTKRNKKTSYETTTPLLFELSDLLVESKSINIRVSIYQNGSIIYNSLNSLNREYIIFDDNNKEVTNIQEGRYYIYSKDFDKLKTPELYPSGRYLYEMYPSHPRHCIDFI